MPERPIFFNLVKTRFGTFQIAASDRGLIQINFPNRYKAASHHSVVPPRAKKILEAGKRFLKCFISGEGYCDKHVPIDWNVFRDFDRRVLKTLKEIPPQTTVSYSELAERVKNPRAARAVGNALNRNPIPILIPCHRVVRKDRSLGGYAGGIRWKQTLLKLEQNH